MISNYAKTIQPNAGRKHLILLPPAVAVLLTALSMIPGCAFWEDLIGETPTERVPGLEKFTSAEAFKQYLCEQVNARNDRSGFTFDFLAAPGGLQTAEAEDTSGGTGDADYSTTNVQEAGVDESDIIKNDGTYLYIVSGGYSVGTQIATADSPAGGTEIATAESPAGGAENTGELCIVRAVPATELAVVSRLDLPGNASELYLRGDRLVTLGSSYGQQGSTTVINVVDVTDRTQPAILTTVEAAGDLNTSRLIGSHLHVVLQTYPEFSYEDDDADLEARTLDELLPDMTVTSADGTPTQQDVVAWDDVYRPITPDGYLLTVVLTMDVDDLSQPIQQAGVVANAGTVYASTEALYLADYNYDYYETTGQSRDQTLISKLEFRAEGAVYVAAGAVPGWLLNRFSLGEYNGYLRVATTTGWSSRGGESGIENQVYVLKAEEGGLVITGQIDNIAPGEQIYSARFIGERGFLVTFEKIDPLFTLDLSDPTNPYVVGELKVPGYSDYIHPLGENHLLTIGKDSVDVGDFSWYQGVQLSVFDVTDFANPQRQDVEIVGERGTESEALYDPHAFNYFASAETLAVPIQLAEGAGPEPFNYGEMTFDGLYLFRVNTTAGIEYLGRISMQDVQDQNGWYYWSGWTRGIFIGDYVYAVTASRVRAVPRDDLGATPIELSLE